MKHLLIVGIAVLALSACSSKETTQESAPVAAYEPSTPAASEPAPVAETPSKKSKKKAYKMENYEK